MLFILYIKIKNNASCIRENNDSLTFNFIGQFEFGIVEKIKQFEHYLMNIFSTGSFLLSQK